MRHDVFPSSMMSPALLSTAKSSSSVPTLIPSGSKHDIKQRCFRNRSATCDGRQAAAAPRPQHAVHTITMQVRAIPSALRGDSLAQHFEDLFKHLPRQFAIRLRTPHQLKQFVLVPSVTLASVAVNSCIARWMPFSVMSSSSGGASRDDLLRQDVQRSIAE